MDLRPGLIAAALLATGLATGCASRTPSAAPHALRSTPGTVASSPLPATSSSAPPVRCTGTMLRVTAALLGAALGNGVLHVLFTNMSGRTCTVRGYPSVVGLDAAGHVLLRPRDERSVYVGGLDGDGPPPLLVVAPGETVSTVVGWTNDPEPCGRSAPTVDVTEVRIAAPGGTPQLLHKPLGGCDTAVTPVHGGTGNFATVHDPPVTIRPCAALTTIPLLQKDGSVTGQSLEVMLTDPGPQYCTLAGFPSVTALDAQGRVVARATDSGRPDSDVLLTNDGSVTISWNATPGCPRSAALTLAPPGSAVAATMQVAVPVCGLRVGPFRNTY